VSKSLQRKDAKHSDHLEKGNKITRGERGRTSCEKTLFILPKKRNSQRGSPVIVACARGKGRSDWEKRGNKERRKSCERGKESYICSAEGKGRGGRQDDIEGGKIDRFLQKKPESRTAKKKRPSGGAPALTTKRVLKKRGP